MKLNEQMEMVDRFSMLVRPVITRRLNPTVRRLTGLTDLELKKGVPFTQAFHRFRKFLGKSVLLSWSMSDLYTLEANCVYYFGSPKLLGVNEYADLQVYCQDMLRLDSQNSLSLMSAAGQLGLVSGEKQTHRAADDAILAAGCMQKLYLRAALLCYIRWVGESFHEESARSIPLEELRTMLRGIYFNCGQCGSRVIRTRRWELKNKGFVSSFRCPHCDAFFDGRVSIRQKHDSIVTVKHILPKEEE